MSSPLTPIPPLGNVPPLQPIWTTTIRRADATRVALNQPVEGERGGRTVPARRVPYTPEGSDLVRQVLLFRAFHGYWQAKNVAVVEYTNADGEVMRVFATSSTNGIHSEAKILLFLQELQRRGELGQVTRLYTEREPCNGIDGGHHCDQLVAGSPLMAGVEVTYSYDYSLRVDDNGKRNDLNQNAEFNAQRERMQERANREGWHAQARQEQAEHDIHILPGTAGEFRVGMDNRPGTVLDTREDPRVAPPPGTVFQETARAYPADDLDAVLPAPNTLNGDGTNP
jgi:hypothetical protein